MDNEKKFWLEMVSWSLFVFIIGFAIGDKSGNQSLKKEITELSIELTKLEIKRLKELSNGS